MATMQERALEKLDALYDIRHAREVIRYLAEYPELEPILIEAHAEIFKLFGDDSQVVLDFWRNVEESSDVSLWVNIYNNLDTEMANKQLDLLDEWFITIIPHCKGSLNFDTKRR